MNNPNIAQDGENTRFKDGQSGNPAGKPKGTRNTKTILTEFFESEIEFEDMQGVPTKMTIADAMHLKQIKNAIKDGDTTAYKALMERFEGMPKQTIEGSHTVQQMGRIKKNGKEQQFKIGD